MVPLKYLSNFWRTFEMLLINCELNLIVTWSAISGAAANQATAFSITDKKTLCSSCNFIQLTVMQNYYNN